MKKFLVAWLILVMAVCFTACGSEEESTDVETSTEVVEEVGGWEVVADPERAQLPYEVQSAFDEFMENYGDELIPMAYYGEQITSGTNYGLLCKSKEEDSIQTVIIQKDSDGVINEGVINTFNIGSYTEGKGAKVKGEPQTGAWEIPDDYTRTTLPEEVQSAFDKATETLDGNELTPMAYLGSQVVAGSNYAVLCHSSLVTSDPVESIQMVTIYEDLDGNAEITNIYTFDIASFAE